MCLEKWEQLNWRSCLYIFEINPLSVASFAIIFSQPEGCLFTLLIVSDTSLMILCISVLSVVISPFSFLILLIWFFSLCFLMSLANGLSILFIFSKKQLLALLTFAMVYLVSFAFISALIFKISFLLLTLGFSSFLPSLVALGVELGYLFDFFLVSWGKPVMLWTFPLALLLQCP